jgi:hypothetical protein
MKTPQRKAVCGIGYIAQTAMSMRNSKEWESLRSFDTVFAGNGVFSALKASDLLKTARTSRRKLDSPQRHRLA